MKCRAILRSRGAGEPGGASAHAGATDGNVGKQRPAALRAPTPASKIAVELVFVRPVRHRRRSLAAFNHGQVDAG